MIDFQKGWLQCYFLVCCIRWFLSCLADLSGAGITKGRQSTVFQLPSNKAQVFAIKYLDWDPIKYLGNLEGEATLTV